VKIFHKMQNNNFIKQFVQSFHHGTILVQLFIENNITGLIGTTVQTMVFGNLNDKSGTGVGFSRSPATGEKKFYGEFLVNAGIRTPKKKILW
jgi:phosphoenolpyruvate synthase/pyruvate phosphate dikinase